jgi:hypothetical protein
MIGHASFPYIKKHTNANAANFNHLLKHSIKTITPLPNEVIKIDRNIYLARAYFEVFSAQM